MLARAAVTALNHILAGEGWARERLRAFGGQHLRLSGGPLALDLTVDGEGYFHPAGDASPGGMPAVTIELPADAPFRLLTGGRESVFAAARLSGTADFAETLAFVFRNLRWDIEDDLSQVVGDIAARRLVSTGATFLSWQKKAAGNLAANLAEYLSEEADVVVPRHAFDRFSADLQALRDDLDRLDVRLGKL